MSEVIAIPTPVIVALIGGVCVLAAAVIAAGTARRREQADRLTRLEARSKSLEDYTYTLRYALAEAGITPPPWPAALIDPS